MTKPRAILVCDCHGWAFENIARQVAFALGDRWKIDIIADTTELGRVSCDAALWFWWQSALRGYTYIKTKRRAIGMYDHWSLEKHANQWPVIENLADVWFVANERLRKNLQERGTKKPIILTEDGVDLDLFRPQPLPAEFTVGWTGNRMYEKNGLGDLKGVRLIETACRRLGVPLVIQDKQQSQIPQLDMPVEFYRKISCYVCASSCEGTPNPVLESLACGRTVVSTDVGIVPKLVRDDRNGYIVDRTLEDIMEGIQQARRLGNRADDCRRAVEPFDWRIKARAFAEVLESPGISEAAA